MISFISNTTIKPISYQENNGRVFLIVIDAAEWNVINPLIEQGELPNFKNLKEKGSWGHLESPTGFSPIEWTSIATGKNEENHGIHNWTKEGRIVTSNDIQSKRIWNILNDYGKSVGVCYYLFTRPPEQVNGFMISDLSLHYLLHNHISNETYPHNLSKEIEENKLTSVQFPDTSTALYLLKKYEPDFFAFGHVAIDKLQHYLWKYWEPEKFNFTDKDKIDKYKKVLIDEYKRMDNFIGELDRYNQTIFVVSDHGAYAVVPPFYVSLFSDMYNELQITEKINITYKRFYEGVNSHRIHLNNEFTEDEKKKIIKMLKSIKYAMKNETFFFNISPSSGNIIEVMFTISLRDITEDHSRQFWSYIPLVSPNGKIFNLTIIEFSGHHKNPSTPGILLAKGEGIKENYEIKDAVTYDITPTILYLYGLPVPKDMDGKVLKDMVKGEYLVNHPVEYLDKNLQSAEKIEESINDVNKTISRKIRERLVHLGYSV